MSRRDDAKAMRRSTIIAAARDMIIETGGDGFSMRALAERAGVSLVTPYSLFGSKMDVITALLDAEVQTMIAFVEAKPRALAIEKLFQLVNETARAHAGNEVYLRYLLKRHYESAQSEKYIGMRDQHISDCVRDAVLNHELSSRIPHSAIARSLSALYAGQMMAYGMAKLTLADLTCDCHTGFALILEPASGPVLKRYLRQYLEG